MTPPQTCFFSVHIPGPQKTSLSSCRFLFWWTTWNTEQSPPAKGKSKTSVLACTSITPRPELGSLSPASPCFMKIRLGHQFVRPTTLLVPRTDLPVPTSLRRLGCFDQSRRHRTPETMFHALVRDRDRRLIRSLAKVLVLLFVGFNMCPVFDRGSNVSTTFFTLDLIVLFAPNFDVLFPVATMSDFASVH